MYVAPNGNKCLLVVIEGPDKLGKATQSALLQANLALKERADGTSIRVGHQEIAARDGITYSRIYKMLENGDAKKFPSTFQAFHSTNRLIWQSQQLPQIASKFDVLILDRWTISSWVYGMASGVDEGEIRCLSEDLVKPDLVFVFEGESFKTPERDDDCYEADKPFQVVVREMYSKWVELNPDVAVSIDANRSKEAIANDILTHCFERLNIT